MTDIGRLEIHKKLGTYHFDKKSAQVDYEYFGRIEMPDEWWSRAMAEVMIKSATSITTAELISKFNNHDDIGQKSMITDLENSDLLLADSWFERYLVTNDQILAKVNDFLQVQDPVIRIAEQKYLQQVPIHIDHEHTQILLDCDKSKFSSDIEESCGSRGASKKFLIALHDMDPTMVLAWGNSIIPPLKRGDVISWKYGTPHCTVNFNKSHRFLLGVIGEIDRLDYINRFNYDYLDTTAYPTPLVSTL